MIDVFDVMAFIVFAVLIAVAVIIVVSRRGGTWRASRHLIWGIEHLLRSNVASEELPAG